MAQTQYTPVITGVENENTPPLRSSQPAVDLPGFFHLVETCMGIFIKTEGQADQVKPTLVHEFPKQRLAKTDDPFNVITYKVSNGEMAATMKDGSKPRSPKQRNSVTHPTLGKNYALKTFGHWEMYQAEFCIWSKSSRNAFLMADWFHTFMMKYAFLYKVFFSRGVQVFRFVKRADDEVDHSFGQELYKCRLTYEFRLEKLLFAEERVLTDLDVYFGVSSPADHIEIQVTPDDE